MESFRFEPYRLAPGTEVLRQEVRDFLEDTLSDFAPVWRARSWAGFDRRISGTLGARGRPGGIDRASGPRRHRFH